MSSGNQLIGRIVSTDDCIEWDRTLHAEGYGVLSIGTVGSSTNPKHSFLVHRLVSVVA